MSGLAPRGVLFVIAVVFCIIAWGRPLPPRATAQEKAEAAEASDKTQELPIQAYYHRAFFGEPWREPELSEIKMEREGMAVLVTLMIVEGALYVRRRRVA